MALETYVYTVTFNDLEGCDRPVALPPPRDYTVTGDGTPERNTVLATQLNRELEDAGHDGVYVLADLDANRITVYHGSRWYGSAHVYQQSRMPNPAVNGWNEGTA